MAEGSPIAGLLGTQPRAGFEVLDSAPARSLTLAGRRRFARYMLTFELTDAAEAVRHLRAPDLRGCFLAPVARPTARWSSALELTPPPPSTYCGRSGG
jgi:hypothetical protein